MDRIRPSSKAHEPGEVLRLPAETVLDAFPGGVALIGSDAAILQLNSELEADTGAQIGQICYEALAGLDSYCPFCPFEQLVSGPAGLGLCGTHVRHERTCSATIQVFQDKGRKLILETVREVTEEDRLPKSELKKRLRSAEEKYKKQAQSLARQVKRRTAALAKETSYLEGILRCSDDMIITTDLDSNIVKFNPGAERKLGYTSQEMEGRDVSELWEDSAERQKIMDEVTATGSVSNYDTRLRTQSGEILEISLTLSLLKDSRGKVLGTVGVSKDVSREKAIMRELERLHQNLREAVHFINHEMKNSLIVMSGFLRRLLKVENDPSKMEQLQIVYHHSQFLEAMSRDFLVLAEVEHGEFRVRKQLIKNFYEEVILPAMVGLKERYPDSIQTYDVSMGGVGAIQLQGDPALLEVVYRNLFGNALKYRFPRGKIAYGFEDRGDSFLFNVWNAGPGVESDHKEKIFEKFYRVHDETTTGKRGTGLGLYNVRRIIEAHGGKIWCESRPGEWMNFLFVIPKK
jgi:PAS domain S-box-containing protein